MLKYVWYSLINKPTMMIAPIETDAGLAAMFAANAAAIIRSEPIAAANSE